MNNRPIEVCYCCCCCCCPLWLLDPCRPPENHEHVRGSPSVRGDTTGTGEGIGPLDPWAFVDWFPNNHLLVHNRTLPDNQTRIHHLDNRLRGNGPCHPQCNPTMTTIQQQQPTTTTTTTRGGNRCFQKDRFLHLSPHHSILDCWKPRQGWQA